MTTEQTGVTRSHVIRHKRKCQDQKVKNHSYHRKRHLSTAHGIPWSEIPAFKPDDPAEPKQAPFNGKALFMKVAWKLFHEAKWPGAHRVPCEMDASSAHGNPFHRCSRCKELVRRSQLHAARCSKDSSSVQGPTTKRRAQLWKGWLKVASLAAKAACKDAKKARNTRSAQRRDDCVDSPLLNCCLLLRSPLRTLAACRQFLPRPLLRAKCGGDARSLGATL